MSDANTEIKTPIVSKSAGEYTIYNVYAKKAMCKLVFRVQYQAAQPLCFTVLIVYCEKYQHQALLMEINILYYIDKFSKHEKLTLFC